MSIFFGADGVRRPRAEAFRNLPPADLGLRQDAVSSATSRRCCSSAWRSASLLAVALSADPARARNARGRGEGGGGRTLGRAGRAHLRHLPRACRACSPASPRSWWSRAPAPPYPSMAGDLGQDWLLPAFLGPVLGGTLLAGGRVSVLGSFLGAVLVSELTNGLLQYPRRRVLGADLARAAAAARRADGPGAAQPSRQDRERCDVTATLAQFSAHRLVRPARDHRGRDRRASARSIPRSCRRSTSRSCCSRRR